MSKAEKTAAKPEDKKDSLPASKQSLKDRRQTFI